MSDSPIRIAGVVESIEPNGCLWAAIDESAAAASQFIEDIAEVTGLYR